MGTTDSASNPVACLRSNCVPFRGPTFFKYKGQDANRKALNRTSDGVTTDPFDTQRAQKPGAQMRSLMVDVKQRSKPGQPIGEGPCNAMGNAEGDLSRDRRRRLGTPGTHKLSNVS